ncbi:MAG: hypothetical protein JO125_07605 [Chloroflexi bacterium]|nr:hypothetical protein [Ktedonobacteraceae bacterium]MBV9021659.1 hypothetical protein [Ktedonobacteraceae bacterium]MBV9707258.1 hypothetical protein [Chloroflexota bacterium]
MSETEQEQQQSDTSASRPALLYTMSGGLPGGRRLTHPIVVEIDYDDDEVIVSEPCFHMHASGPTRVEALAAFRRIFSGYLDLLAQRESTLGPPLRDQLQYLRSVIASE